jgi:prepilin-type N-terminal cleavage/methylation domain-containing protein
MDCGTWNMKTRRQSGKWKGERGSNSDFPFPHSSFPFPHSSFPFSARSAFTLTELLVVITIIAILAALITAGAVNALNASKRAAITLEIGQLADGIERFKNETGGAYPPNAMNFQTPDPLVINDFIRSFRKAFPRHQEHEGLLRRLAGQTGSLGSENPPSNATALPGGMNSAEALYFWLGGFSADPVYPISGAGGPAFDISVGEVMESRNRLYEFDLARLGPRNSAGVFNSTDLPTPGPGRFVTYNNPTTTGGPTLRINLWTYAPRNSTSSFAYFDASRHDPVTYDLDMSGSLGANIFALKKIREGFSGTGTPTTSDIHFVNKGKYQILHAGLDNAWGDLSPGFIGNATSPTNASNLLLFPTGPFTGDIADTLSNFAPGTLESAQE